MPCEENKEFLNRVDAIATQYFRPSTIKEMGEDIAVSIEIAVKRIQTDMPVLPEPMDLGDMIKLYIELNRALMRITGERLRSLELSPPEPEGEADFSLADLLRG